MTILSTDLVAHRLAEPVTDHRPAAPCAEPPAPQRLPEYRDELMHPYYAAERGLVDDVIDPADARRVLIRSLAMLRHKHASLPERKHGNPPV